MRWLISVSLLLLFVQFRLNAQQSERTLSYYLKLLPADLVSTCNTASGIKDMSQEEKNAVLVANLARVNPKLFSKVILHDYVTHSSELNSNNPYVLSLKRTLETMEPVPPLKVEKVLNEVAFSHADYCGRSGYISHKNFEKRSAIIRQKLKHYYIGENCSFGWDTGLDFVIDLLVDEGVESIGHRKNLLNSTYTSIGISIQPIKGGGHCMVQMFSAE
jgi:uncharacterized protein YkwD